MPRRQEFDRKPRRVRAAVAAVVLLVPSASAVSLEPGTMIEYAEVTIVVGAAGVEVGELWFDEATGAPVLDGVAFDIRSFGAPATWNLTTFSPTLIRLEATLAAPGTIRLPGLADHRLTGVPGDPDARTSTDHAPTWNLPPGVIALEARPRLPGDPDAPWTQLSLAPGQTVWNATRIDLTVTSNASTTILGTRWKAWRDGETEPTAWASGNLTIAKAGRWSIRYYSWDAEGREELPRLDVVSFGHTVRLRQGWNLVALPRQDHALVADALAQASIASVWTVNDSWQVFSPGLPPGVQDTFRVEPTTPLFINATSDATLYLPYSMPPSFGSVTLRQGWNAVVLSHLRDPASISDLFKRGQAQAAWRWDAERQSWDLWNPENPLAKDAFAVDATMTLIVYMKHQEAIQW